MSTEGWRHRWTVSYGTDLRRAPSGGAQVGQPARARGPGARAGRIVGGVDAGRRSGGRDGGGGRGARGAAAVTTAAARPWRLGVPIAGTVVCLCGVGLAVAFNRFEDAWSAGTAPEAAAGDAGTTRRSASEQSEAADDAAVRAKLPPFDFVHNNLSGARGRDQSRDILVEATGDVDEADVYGIVNYVVRFRPAGRLAVDVTARAGQDVFELGAGRVVGPDKAVRVSPANVSAYRKAAGLPATRPAAGRR